MSKDGSRTYSLSSSPFDALPCIEFLILRKGPYKLLGPPYLNSQVDTQAKEVSIGVVIYFQVTSSRRRDGAQSILLISRFSHSVLFVHVVLPCPVLRCSFGLLLKFAVQVIQNHANTSANQFNYGSRSA